MAAAGPWWVSYTIIGDDPTSAPLSPSSCPSASSNVPVILDEPYNSGIPTGGVKPGAAHDYVAALTPLIEKARKIEAVCGRHGVELGAKLAFGGDHEGPNATFDRALAETLRQRLRGPVRGLFQA